MKAILVSLLSFLLLSASASMAWTLPVDSDGAAGQQLQLALTFACPSLKVRCVKDGQWPSGKQNDCRRQQGDELPADGPGRHQGSWGTSGRSRSAESDFDATSASKSISSAVRDHPQRLSLADRRWSLCPRPPARRATRKSATSSSASARMLARLLHLSLSDG